MDTVSRELSSLTLCLETLRNDATEVTYPENMHRNLVAVIGNCDILMAQMLGLLQKLSSDDLAQRLEWTANSQVAMKNLRSGLECHKSALDIALDMSPILSVLSVSQHTEEIQPNTAGTKSGMSQPLSSKGHTSQITDVSGEIGLLRLQLSEIREHDRSGSVILERFLDESGTYAQAASKAKSPANFNPECAGDQAELAVVEEDVQYAPTLAGSSSADFGCDKFLVLDESRGHCTDATSNTSTSGTKSSSEAALRQTEDPSRQMVRAGLKDNLGDGLSSTAQARNKVISRKPVPCFSAPELDLRQFDGTAGDAWAPSQNSIINNDVGDRPVPLELLTNPAPEINLRLAKPDDAPLIPVETNKEHGKVEYALVEEAVAKWEKLSPSKKLKLHKHFEVLIKGKREFLQSKDFWLSVSVGSFEDIKKALDNGARPNAYWGCDPNGFPLDPLVTEMRNAKRGPVIGLLLRRGARADNLDKILIAASSDHHVVVELLLDYGADVEARDRPNNSPLSYAAENGSCRMVKLLLGRGADVNGRAGRFGTALQTASHRGSLNIVEHLLDRGADVNAQGGFYGNALQAACWWRHTMVVQLLLEAGADVNALGQYGTALRAARVSNVQCGEQQTRQTINLLIAYGALDDKRAEDESEIRPVLPPRPSGNSPISGQSLIAGLKQNLQSRLPADV